MRALLLALAVGAAGASQPASTICVYNEGAFVLSWKLHNVATGADLAETSSYAVGFRKCINIPTTVAANASLVPVVNALWGERVTPPERVIYHPSMARQVTYTCKGLASSYSCTQGPPPPPPPTPTPTSAPGTIPFSLDNPFHEFSLQCSHNTYLWGQQSGALGLLKANSVDREAVKLALELGYRCLELDLHRSTAGIYVAHTGPLGINVTNTESLKPFLSKIQEWCEEDESQHPASLTSPKLPIFLSLDSHAEDEGEPEVATDLIHYLGDRIVLRGDLPPGTALRNVSAVNNNKRRVILRSRTNSKVESFLRLLAICRGECLPSWNMSYTSSNHAMGCLEAKDVSGYSSSTNLVRTYTCGDNRESSNYNPSIAFQSRANFVCINWQGRCRQTEDYCTNVRRGAGTSDSCPCERDYSAQVEDAFQGWGYDGYIHYPTLTAEAWSAFTGFTTTTTTKWLGFLLP